MLYYKYIKRLFNWGFSEDINLYSEININLYEDFPKGMEYLVEDSKDLMEEIEFEELHNKNGRDKGKSCQII